MGAAELVRVLVRPIIEQNGAELYDLEYESGNLRVSVDRDGGIDVDTIGEIARQISDALDREDPIAEQRYLLEVTSPGVERKLRTPEHFRKQVGEQVSLKFRNPQFGVRRMQAELVDADDEAVHLLLSDQADTVKIFYADIDSARSVYDWTSGEKNKLSKESLSKDPELSEQNSKSAGVADVSPVKPTKKKAAAT